MYRTLSKKVFVFIFFLLPVLVSADSGITLLFGGDIMAHKNNYYVADFSEMWKDVKDIIQKGDLAFANIEAPVDATREISFYPQFNMSREYLMSSIDAGFSVFSLCNNHSNDQGKGGMLETVKSCNIIAEKYGKEGRTLYFSGLKNSPDEPFSYNIIEKNGWKILFFPVTESLNSFDSYKYINYISPATESRERFVTYVRRLREKVPCDIFILSLHTNEPEYVRSVSDTQKKYYEDLIEAGVDIVWANHTHLIKDREIITDREKGRQALIMYANGNTISGQRTSPNITMEDPNTQRDNTGDGLLYEVRLIKDDSGAIRIERTQPYFITTYLTPNRECLVKPMNDEFIGWLKETKQPKWAGYIERRLKINQTETKDIIR